MPSLNENILQFQRHLNMILHKQFHRKLNYGFPKRAFSVSAYNFKEKIDFSLLWLRHSGKVPLDSSHKIKMEIRKHQLSHHKNNHYLFSRCQLVHLLLHIPPFLSKIYPIGPSFIISKISETLMRKQKRTM